MTTNLSEELLRNLAEKGEMPVRDFLQLVPRVTKDHLDFYPISALLHSKYVTTDSTTETGGEKIRGKLGKDIRDSSFFLWQLTLSEGESFTYNGNLRTAIGTFPLRVYLTPEGYLRLEELDKRELEKKRKRNDYLITIAVAILAALLSSFLNQYLTAQRQMAIQQTQPVTNDSTP